MDPDEVRMLVDTLLNVWEHAVAREDALRLTAVLIGNITI
jgi:hypothetical protein